MSTGFNQGLFAQVFSDAHVIDVDLSEWDRRISLCVIADHVEVPTPVRLPIFIVDFLHVSKFSLTFNHLAIDLEDEGRHFQWRIDDFKVKESGGRLMISLFGSRTWPRLVLECRDIVFRQLPLAMLDTLFPGWNAPYSALARPGIESLNRLFGRRDKGQEG